MPIVEVTKPRPHVSLITLNNPTRVNALSFELVEGLYDALTEVERDNDTWVVVLTGAGRGFCSGLDLHDRGMPPNTEGLGFARLAMKSMSYMGGVVPNVIALLNEIRQTVRPDLIILVMSATLDAGPVAEFLGGCPVIRVEGRTHPVQVEYRPAARDQIIDRVADELDRIVGETSGDVLVFQPGAEEIRRTIAQIAPIVQAVCAEHGVRYTTHDSIVGAVRSHGRWLRQLGATPARP